MKVVSLSAFIFLSAMSSSVLCSEAEYVDTGLFRLDVAAINTCYHIEDRDKRVSCFGDAVESSWQTGRQVKERHRALISSGKAIFTSPSDFDGSDLSKHTIFAYLRRVVCGGADCIAEDFAQVRAEAEVFGKLLKHPDGEKVNLVIKGLYEKGIVEPKYSQILAGLNEPVTVVPDAIAAQIKADIVAKHPGDYYIQGLMVEQAEEAYLSVTNMKSYEGVPDSILNSVKSKIAEKHSGDYYIQKLLIEQELKAYIELNQ